MRPRPQEESRVRIGYAAAVLLGAVLAQTVASSVEAQGPDSKLVARGRYLAAIMDCGGCHTPGALAGQPDATRRLAGSDIGFGGPGGVVYPKNLTPDRDTGLGAWSDAEIMRAIRQGQSRNGRPLAPVMPWPSYATLTLEDARALVAYLRTIPAVKFTVPADVKAGERVTAPYLSVVTP
jgi:mono/diheme cytochrome c family protein